MFARRTARSLTLLVLLAAPLRAQDHQHPAPAAERLGTVHFPTSCASAVTPTFDRAIALLHSFEFSAAQRAFDAVLAADSTCAVAWWGIALARWTNPMTPNIRPPALVARGREATIAGARVASHATPRERDYLAAVAELYTESDQRTRVVAYERAMSALSAKYPDDTEARIFYALALTGAALPSDKTYANQLRAGAMLEQMWAVQPDHPGLAHYIIHSYDVPALAERAAAAARRYADIAPAAAHALHMPSHTFTRVGLWRESAATNIRSFDIAMSDSSLAEALHAADYRVYAYLQLRQDSAALAIVRSLPAIAARFDPTVSRGAAPGSAGVFALAAIPARYVIERRAWNEAAALTVTPSAIPYADALTYFTRSLGASHRSDTLGARVAIDSLGQMKEKLVTAGEAYWAEQVEIQRLGASAWLDYARGNRETALTTMQAAAAREDLTEKAAVSPGPLVPARELLGDMLLAMGRPIEALAEYRKSIARDPHRYRSVLGAAEAAEAAKDPAAEAYRREIAELTRPETR